MNLKLKNIIADILYIGIFVGIYLFSKFYVSFLKLETLDLIKSFSLFFIGLSIIINLFFQEKPNKRVLFFKLVYKILKQIKRKLINIKDFQTDFKISKSERILLLSFLVKLFYIPLMLNFCVNNFYQIKPIISENIFSNYTNFIDFFNNHFFGAIIAIVFFLDTLIYAFGYLFESKYLNNEIKSVEPTFFGWFICLICYPPFNEISGKFISWSPNDHAYYYNETITIFVRLIIVILLIIYVSASINLGTKASNLTNRGIVKNGVYSIVRHPAYISKNLMWWISSIPILILNPIMIFGTLTWSIIYFLRAITEENHLLQDKDYQDYCKNVKYRFIPRVF